MNFAIIIIIFIIIIRIYERTRNTYRNSNKDDISDTLHIDFNRYRWNIRNLVGLSIFEGMINMNFLVRDVNH